MFLIVSLVLLCEDEVEFLSCILKGGVVAAVIIPLAHTHFGDKSKYKFSL